MSVCTEIEVNVVCYQWTFGVCITLYTGSNCQSNQTVGRPVDEIDGYI